MLSERNARLMGASPKVCNRKNGFLLLRIDLLFFIIALCLSSESGE